MDVSSWLRDLGLENYAQAFRANHIDAAVLSRLSAEDLIALGISSVGHRRRLLDAIALLKNGTAPARAEPVAATVRPAAAERRQLTVLFCDLVGSTEIAARLDPEDLRDVMRAYQAACAEVIGRFEGHVAKFLGDGVLAYFGWPQAHEDDAERAVRAGLALVEAVARLDADPDTQLRARVGIATGQVVVGDLVGEGASREEAVVGDVPNLAARLQGLAEPGGVVIGQATRRLIGGVFELDDLGPQPLKGFVEPLMAWRVAAEGRAEGRFEARQTAALTPLVGREEEIALLLRRWQQASDGEGQVVLLAGEPGIGKSRIVRELRDRLAGEPHIRLLYQCSPHHTTSPLHPLIEQLERAAGFARDDPPETRLDKLEALLGRGTDRVDEAAPLVAALLGLPTDRYPPLDLTPQRQKQRTLEVLVDQLAGLAAAHWIDPTTQELLGLAIERIRRLPVLAIITFRPDFMPPWAGQPHVSALAVSRLGRRDGASMVEQVVGAKALPAEVSAQIVAKTDGVPLFVEELTKTVLESSLLRDAGDRYELAGPLPPLAIPATLHDSLLARLDRLAPVKEVAQIGAALGREFSHALLAAVSPLPEADLSAALDQLLQSELIFRHGTPPEATYSFKHALVQDAAYGTLLKSRRLDLHTRIAGALENRFADTVERQPELLAHHLTEAGLVDPAIEFWLKAGRAASAKSANKEAIGHFGRALALLGTLPPSDRRWDRELDLQIALGAPLIATKGFAAPEVEVAYSRAEYLARHLRSKKRLATALRGLCYLHHVRARFQRTDELSGELVELAELSNDLLLISEAHNARAFNLYHLGRHLPAWEHLQKSGEAIERGRLANAFSLGVNIEIFRQAYTAHCLWHLGYPDRALEAAQIAIDLADRLAHPFSTVLSLAYAAMLHQFRRQPSQLRERAEAARKASIEHGFSYYRAWATILLGWASAEEGSLEEGIRQVGEGIRDLNATGAELRLPYYLGIQADLHRRRGEFAEASAVLAEALTVAGRNGECWHDPNLFLLEGELFLAADPAGAAEAAASLRHATEIARDQGSRALVLRVAVRLARLESDQGKRVEAYDLLAPVYGWFTEGFDTADLKDAKALLDELA